MILDRPRAALGSVAVAVLLAFATTTDAAPISKCNATKKKCIGKYVAAVMGCHAKAETKNQPVDPLCLAKAEAKITGGGKGCFDKADAKGDACSNPGDAGPQLSQADALILDVVTDIDPGYPTPHINKCDAAQKKCAGKKAAGLLSCSAKENQTGLADPLCAAKVESKFTNVDNKGCFDKAVIKDDGPCDGATAAGIEAKVDTWATAAAAAIDAVCGDGIVDLGEFCDLPDVGACGPEFACVACTCACPTRADFVGDATATETKLDLGWTGITHRHPVATNDDVSVSLSCAASTRPCGTCTVSGPIANPNAGAGQLDNQRCTNDQSRSCTSDATCTPRTCLGGANNNASCSLNSQCPGGTCPFSGTCQFFTGAPLPLAAGGVTTCVVSQFNGSVSGTVNVESGEAATAANATWRVYSGPGIDNPCPRCSDAGAINDNVNGGTCDAGPRVGLACDANATIPGRPDFGRTSLDCPPNPAAIIAVLPIDLTNATSDVVRTLTSSSPDCSGAAGQKCLCGTCNNANAEPCDSNADCPVPPGPIGPICNGRRCMGGGNNGAACAANSTCPGGTCSRPGEPTKPSGCLDDTSIVDSVHECSDTFGGDPLDGEGRCTLGPSTQSCSLASGHAQRGCIIDGDCGGGPGSCEVSIRRCFLTGGGATNQGTDTLIASGMADPPVGDTAHPTVGAVFCVSPTASAAVNNVAGLPGPARLTIRGTARAHP